jgi:cysteinyl-tRNA synthetase
MSPEQIHLYNSMTRTLEVLKTRNEDSIGFYCCGPTVYGPAHIGNFRTFISQDVFRRVVELAGFTTCHVRNLTDVDDKTIRGAQAVKTPLADFTSQWVKLLHADCEKLTLLPPHHEPSAVAHIPQQIELISVLEKRGLTYNGADGSIFFRIASFPGYGKLSRVVLDTLSAEAGRGVSSDEYDKENAADFALWKARKEDDGDNFWDSPWGEGRPGWHIECSAMALHYLKSDFDVHGGGEDLLFPHHENEIAQSEAATGCTFARYWFHAAHLMVDSHKMSKSLGNLYTLSDLEQRGFSGREVKYALLQGHYRKPLNFTFESLRAARQTLQRLDRVFVTLQELTGESIPSYQDLIERCRTESPSQWLPESLKGSWNDLRKDLNVPAALGGVIPASKSVVDKKDLKVSSAREWQWFLGLFTHALGLSLELQCPQVEVPENIQHLAIARAEARSNKNWKEADKLRDELLSQGWHVKDSGSAWELLQVDEN